MPLSSKGGRIEEEEKKRTSPNGDYSVYKIAAGLLLCTNAAKGIYGIY
jgi:hypothetical protein